ncbi:HAD family hydrolase [Vibrio methylphosphonaticus]|uniref:HAD family hydrolase n=1 Tax=Vibrio methylphosphonaticus TaxID=2946866 RepID=UPI002029C2A6|nr:HAD family hydrolase [Vibrio methylphosphonaticus]MCL9774633.1 HAD family hydrolase [Vibrio methylphosphonaticus]
MHSTIKFIATDMDGTLLDPNGQLTPDFFPLYERIKEQGIYFAPASGRQYYSLKDIFSRIQDELIFIAENGTLVMHNNEELYSCILDTAATKAIIKTTRALDNTYMVLCGKHSAYIETQDPRALEEIRKYYHRCEYVDDLLSVEDDFIKVAICNFEGAEQYVFPTINDRFGDEYQVVVSAKIWLDVMNKEASKGAAIRFLQQHLGFKFEETMSFGDYFNDVEMLKESYHSYAMDNAHPEIKKLSRFIAPSNDKAGVLKVVDKYLATIE